MGSELTNQQLFHTFDTKFIQLTTLFSSPNYLFQLREACISFSTTNQVIHHDPELWRLTQDEETFVKELNELVQSFCQLEAKVEETRSGVINKKNKISLVDVEAMALTLSKCSKTVTLLKQAFPTLEANIKANPPTVQNPDKRRMTEDFLKRTPDRMENIWRRCKKLTGKWKTLIFHHQSTYYRTQ